MTLVATAQTTKPKPKPAPPRIGPATKPKPATPAEKKAAPAPEPPPAPTDIKINTKSINGAQVTETGMYFTKTRQRFDFPGIVMITQCDLKRTLQINDGAKVYMVQTFEDAKTQAAAPPAASSAQPAAAAGSTASPAPKGGIIKYTTTTTDTGERKTIFGLEARHIKVVSTREPSSEACDKRLEKVETDGWYVDLPNYAACTSAPQPWATAQSLSTEPGACVDRIEAQATGDAKLGFSVLSTVTTTSGEKQDVSIIATEVTDLQVTTLDPALFDVPPGYSEVKGYPELLPGIAAGGSVADAVFGSITAGTSAVAPKLAGFVRIGIIEPVNKTAQAISAPMLREGLTSGFSKRPFDSVPVMGKTPDDIARDAQQKEVDYLLSSELVEVKTSKPSRIGGLVRRASGDAAKEIHEARVDYKLFAVDNQAKARLSSSARASSSGLGASAVRLARFAGSTYVNLMPGGSLVRGYLPLAEMGLGPTGPMMPGMMTPGVGAAMTILSLAQNWSAMRTGVGAPGSSEAEILETISDAMGNTSRAVIEEISKKK
jgi:hypothetical protein